MTAGSSHDVLIEHAEENLAKHGDTHLGAGWPILADRHRRFDVMLDIMLQRPAAAVRLCDLACGTGELLSRIRQRNIANIDYIGVDRSEKALGLARRKHPDAAFLNLDVSDAGSDLSPRACDYLVANGLFTMKLDMSDEVMWAFLETAVRRVWPLVRKGLAFNVMSKIVDWERDDLFHVPMDKTARLLHSLAGRHVMIRADYGLYEYTAYAFRGDPAINLLGDPPQPPA